MEFLYDIIYTQQHHELKCNVLKKIESFMINIPQDFLEISMQSLSKDQNLTIWIA